MKEPRKFRALAFLGAALVALSAQAQRLDLSARCSSNSVLLGSSLTFTITVTNRIADLSAVFITNAFTRDVQFISSSNSFNGGFTSTGNTGLFTFINVPLGRILSMTLEVEPNAAGLLTNRITAVPNTIQVIPATTNIAAVVVAPEADLSLRLTARSNDVLVNDPVSYSLVVSNAGPTAAGNVIATTTLPPAKLLGIQTTNQYTAIGNQVLFFLGTLGKGTSRAIAFALQPTNAGPLVVAGAVGSADQPDANRGNNTATNTVQVSDPLQSDLQVTNVTAMAFDHQTGLMKQTVRLGNLGTNSVPSTRVIVTGLTERLFNAVGTNDGHPFVLYSAALDPGKTVDLVLEYWVPSRVPIAVSNSNYRAMGVPAPIPPTGGGTTNSLSITVSRWLTNGTFLMEFPAVAGASYSVLYSSDPQFTTNVLVAQPPIIAPANRVQWIDNGPPRTISPPSQASPRYYKVRQN